MSAVSSARAPRPVSLRSVATVIFVCSAALALLGCGVKTVSKSKSFDATSDEAIVVMAARAELPPDFGADIHDENRLQLYYSVVWRKYDPATDTASKMPSPDFFAVRIGHNSGFLQTCKLIDDWLYCVDDVEPASYVMEGTGVGQNKPLGQSGVYGAGRSSLGVGKNFMGGIEVNNDIPVSESGAQRFRLEPGRIYYLGEYSLSQYGQILALGFDEDRARQALAEFPNIRGQLEKPEFHEPYRLQLRTGFCPLFFRIQSSEYSTENPCTSF